MKKDYIEKINPDAERRSIAGCVEKRMDEEGVPEIFGVACVFEQPTDMGWYIEKVARGAFDGCDMSDVVALMNHDDDEILSRTTNAPDDLVLQVTDAGLEYKFKAKNEAAKEVAENIQLGFIKGSSFAFVSRESLWEEEVLQADGSKKDVRTITKFEKLYDVSPVTWPAYNQTSVALRTKEALKKEIRQADKYDLKILNKVKK